MDTSRELQPTAIDSSVPLDRIPCTVCQHEIPSSEALVAEATDYLVYFCGLDCYNRWLNRRARAPVRILLQTTIPSVKDDWNIERFTLLREYLASLTGDSGSPLYEVVARDREADPNGDDPVLAALDRSEFDELWLFAVDTGNGLSGGDCAGIMRFQQRGRGILATRDHQDLGSSLCMLGGVGCAHFFHSRSPEPDHSRRSRDDSQTESISWPNYHSGRNGDYQRIQPVGPIHELLRQSASSGVVEYFAAHPHEGAVHVPAGERNARVIATGTSQATGRVFNLAIAFDRATDADGNRLGRGIAESSFHHFADYNWDPDKGAPSFVTEPCGNGIKDEPLALDHIKTYVRNLAAWLAPGAPGKTSVETDSPSYFARRA